MIFLAACMMDILLVVMMDFLILVINIIKGVFDCLLDASKLMVVLLWVLQTWNLSKILHRRIFRLKILHCQFHLISTVLVGKNKK